LGTTFCRNLEPGIAPSQQEGIHHPRTRCHRRSFPDKAQMWMQMDTDLDLTSAVEEHHHDESVETWSYHGLLSHMRPRIESLNLNQKMNDFE
jgi:hypothetical protein